MAKLRLTKNELRRQKEALKRYERFLPTLQLKKQQLQAELGALHQRTEKLRQEKEYLQAEVYKWVDVFAEEVGLSELVRLAEVKRESGNIAGVEVPVYEDTVFDEKEYDLFATPLWVDSAIEALKDMLRLNAQLAVLKEQEALLARELRTTTQRVNLFEKVMIPGTQDNIRTIQIYLGDLETAAVVTGKIAKKKIEMRGQPA